MLIPVMKRILLLFVGAVLVGCGVDIARLNKAAEAHEDKGEYRSSIDIRTELLLENSNDTLSLYNRGVAYHALGKLDSAILDYKSLLLIDSNHLEGNFNLAVAYQTQEKFEETIKYLSAIINQKGISFAFKDKDGNPIMNEANGIVQTLNLDEVFHQRANSYFKLKNYEAALQDYQVCLKRNYKVDVIMDIVIYCNMQLSN